MESEGSRIRIHPNFGFKKEINSCYAVRNLVLDCMRASQAWVLLVDLKCWVAWTFPNRQLGLWRWPRPARARPGRRSASQDRRSRRLSLSGGVRKGRRRRRWPRLSRRASWNVAPNAAWWRRRIVRRRRRWRRRWRRYGNAGLSVVDSVEQHVRSESAVPRLARHLRAALSPRLCRQRKSPRPIRNLNHCRPTVSAVLSDEEGSFSGALHYLRGRWTTEENQRVCIEFQPPHYPRLLFEWTL